jgi:ribosomal protein L11 methyltransferase
MELWEKRVEIPADAAGATETVLLESGLEHWVVLEDAVAKRAWVVGTFPGQNEAESGWRALRGLLPAAPLQPPSTSSPVALDWTRSYRDHFKAWTFGRLHWVPVWERREFHLPAGHAVLWLDPGMAFGTGNHETTRLCIERLVAFEASLGDGAAGNLRVVDAGCGSGILALSAALLGFGDVAGFDLDPEATRVSLANAELNGLSGRVRFSTSDLPEGLLGAGADVVLANIQADVLSRHAGALAAAVAPGGLLAMSGILATEAGAVREAFGAATPGWAASSRVMGEWCDLCLRRPPA